MWPRPIVLDPPPIPQSPPLVLLGYVCCVACAPLLFFPALHVVLLFYGVALYTLYSAVYSSAGGLSWLPFAASGVRIVVYCALSAWSAQSAHLLGCSCLWSFWLAPGVRLWDLSRVVRAWRARLLSCMAPEGARLLSCACVGLLLPRRVSPTIAPVYICCAGDTWPRSDFPAIIRIHCTHRSIGNLTPCVAFLP